MGTRADAEMAKWKALGIETTPCGGCGRTDIPRGFKGPYFHRDPKTDQPCSKTPFEARKWIENEWDVDPASDKPWAMERKRWQKFRGLRMTCKECKRVAIPIYRDGIAPHRDAKEGGKWCVKPKREAL